MIDTTLKKQWKHNALQRRREVVGRGGRWLSVLLDPEANEALKGLCKAKGESAVKVISDLLIASMQRRRK